jgi:GNAT superfamily N-acetyltransferase/SAM-dependent methyltransferase
MTAHRETSRLTYGISFTDELIERAMSFEMTKAQADPETGMVGYLGDKPVGIAMVEDRERDGKKFVWVHFFYISPEFRGQGYGKQLLKYAEKFARKRGYSSYNLRTSTLNPAAIRFYVNNGFTYVHGEDKISGNGIAQQLYIKTVPELTTDDNIIDHYTPLSGGNFNEDFRFDMRDNFVEYFTTLHYIEKFLTPNARILEIGAASGRYSHHYAKRGYEVDAIELVPFNIEQFKAKTQPGERVTIREGNATNLSCFADNSYDITLLLGPMYHLFDESDKLKALSEALRVTKPGGIVFIAWATPDAIIFQYGFMRQPVGVLSLINKGLLDPVTFKAVSNPNEVFELHRKEDIDTLMSNFPNTERLHYVAADLLSHYIAPSLTALSDEVFDIYLRYHLSICERPDMVGVTNHVLDVVKKI